MIYLDTGCLVKLYYPEEDSEVIAIKTAGLQIGWRGQSLIIDI
jgi:hypothetical protein